MERRSEVEGHEANLKHDSTFEIRQEIVDEIRQDLPCLMQLSCLDDYKASIIQEDSVAAAIILEEQEIYIKRAIFAVRKHIQDLRTPDKDRNQLARDLHDVILQNLTTLFFEIQYCQKLLAKDCADARREYPSLRNLFLDNKLGIERLPYMPDGQEEGYDFMAALYSYVNKLSDLADLDVDLSVKGMKWSSRKISAEVKHNLLLILKEALINIKKHAIATKVKIKLVRRFNYLTVEVYDNGIGFALNGDESSFFGIRGMRERAQAIGSELSIETSSEKGTRVTARVHL